uniref:Xylulose kinase-1 n=1 Tax=Tanacetum cinerariifolium TaxID=118510 RepID=A0A699HWF2_TANCI|nr:xylulose kinase-1 [Tanacetum cinerariifolium]GEY75457.1 xylulose kinase-1 [Tanacetum cinerariifolium]
MTRLAFCDYHNMIAILEKYELNQDFYQIVDFVEASHIRYALTFNPTVYVSHIRQFWSTSRIETTEEGTKILAIVDDKLRTISESSIRRNLKLNDEAGISEGSGTPTELHHTPSPEAQQTLPTTHSSLSLPSVTTEPLPTVTPFDTPQLRQYTKRARIAQSSALPTAVNKPAFPLGDGNQGEACPTITSLVVGQDMANIIKTFTLPSDSTPRVTSLAADEGSMQHQIQELTALCTSLQRKHTEMASKIEAQELEIINLKARDRLLEEKEGSDIAQSGEDAPIKGRSLDEGEVAATKRSTERGNDDTEEMANVLSSLDTSKILTSGGVQVSISPAVEFATATVSIPTGSSSIPTASSPGTGIPTGSGMVLTASLIFTTATESTHYTRRKGKEKMRMNEQITRDAEIARIHAEEELQMMIDGLDRNNETVAKYLQEYHQFATELPIERRIELIILRSHAGWKARHFKGMTLEEIKEKLIQCGSRFKILSQLALKKKLKDSREKGLRLEQDSSKKLKTSEEVPEEKLKEMMELIPVEELWALVKETLNIRPATNDKEKELLVELKRLYKPDVEDLLWTHTQNLMHAPVQ